MILCTRNKIVSLSPLTVGFDFKNMQLFLILKILFEIPNALFLKAKTMYVHFCSSDL